MSDELGAPISAEELEVGAEMRAYARTIMLGRHPHHAITLEEHRALTADMDRPLTQSPIMRHHSTGNANMLGDIT
jgi:hypothetical protein